MSYFNFLPSVIGICVALGAPILLASFGDKIYSNSNSLIGKVLQQIILVIILFIVVVIVVFWEQQPLSSLGLHSLRWQSILWGLIFAGFLIFIYSPCLIWTIQKLGLTGFETGLAKLSSLPIWYLILATVIGGLLALVAFGLAHVPLWGWIASLTTIVSGGLLTIFYLWTGDLLTAIVAHIITLNCYDD